MNREDIIRMAREVFDVEIDARGRETFSGDEYGIERFATLVAEHEREACAKHAAEFLTRGRSPLGHAVGDAIRARGDKHD